MEAWRTCGTRMMGDILCQPVLVPSCLKLNDANDKFGAERNRKTVKNLPDHLSGKLTRCACWPLFSTVATGSNTLGVAVGLLSSSPRTQLLAKSRRHPSYARGESSCARVSRQKFALLRECLGVSRIKPHPPGARPQSCKRNELMKSTARLDKRPLERTLPGIHGGTVRSSAGPVLAWRTRERRDEHSLQPNRASWL